MSERYGDLTHCIEAAYPSVPKYSLAIPLEKDIGKCETPGVGTFNIPKAVGVGPSHRGPHPMITCEPRMIFPCGERSGGQPNTYKNPGPGHYFTKVEQDQTIPWAPR